MRVPAKVTTTEIRDPGHPTKGMTNNQWVVARPIGFRGWFLITRIKIAWRVFTSILYI